jgi:hypothetical protein
MGLPSIPQCGMGSGVYGEAAFKQAKLPVMISTCPLRDDAAPCILPGDRPACRRGRDHCDGRDHPPKQACQRRGWSAGLFHLVGGRLSRRRSWPWQPTVYTIRVVVTEPTGLRALDCTQPQPCWPASSQRKRVGSHWGPPSGTAKTSSIRARRRCGCRGRGIVPGPPGWRPFPH